MERVAEVAATLSVLNPAPTVITVGGTNGKGSTVASLEAMLLAGGYTVGAYSSPHIHRFNERIRLAGADVSDSALCDAFETIEQQRAGVSLSYFEFATLAALLLFKRHEVDVAILEVGLGGRLDSVNIVDAHVVVITSISLDHQEWLGNDLETIGREKAGIMRELRPVVLANTEMPKSIIQRADTLGCKIYQLGKEFQLSPDTELQQTWVWSGLDCQGIPIQKGGLPAPMLNHGSVSASVQVLELINKPIREEKLASVLKKLKLAGRFEQRVDQSTGASVIFDVSHNPAAAQDLAVKLTMLRSNLPKKARVIAVLAVLSDKDIEGIVVSLQSCVDIWYIAQVEGPRRLGIEGSMSRLLKACPDTLFTPFETVESAYRQACKHANSIDWVLVAGSFHTVSSVRELSRAP